MKHKKIGVLGGGQLGRMLQEEARRWNLPMYCMDQNATDPASVYADLYVRGNIKDYDDVINFGQDKDILTIEIEHVNIEALFDLEKQGKEIHPRPEALYIIKNKNRQHSFYSEHNFPVPKFVLLHPDDDFIQIFKQSGLTLPCIYKSAEMGYDGKGVRTMHTIEDIANLPRIEGLLQEKVQIASEVAVMIARNQSGEHVLYDPVLMTFDERNHVLSRVDAPAQIPKPLVTAMNDIAVRLTGLLGICGLCALEFFICHEGKLWINEVAPRPHNSMHISMNNCVTSQFQQHLRGILNLPLGDTTMTVTGTMINLLGQDADLGEVNWTGWEQTLALQGVYIHLYGKKAIKPARKMGHINIVDNDVVSRENKINQVIQQFKHHQNG